MILTAEAVARPTEGCGVVDGDDVGGAEGLDGAAVGEALVRELREGVVGRELVPDVRVPDVAVAVVVRLGRLAAPGVHALPQAARPRGPELHAAAGRLSHRARGLFLLLVVTVQVALHATPNRLQNEKKGKGREKKEQTKRKKGELVKKKEKPEIKREKQKSKSTGWTSCAQIVHSPEKRI